MKPVTPEESLVKPSLLPQLKDEAHTEKISQWIVSFSADLKRRIGDESALAKVSCRTGASLRPAKPVVSGPKRRPMGQKKHGRNAGKKSLRAAENCIILNADARYRCVSDG